MEIQAPAANTNFAHIPLGLKTFSPLYPLAEIVGMQWPDMVMPDDALILDLGASIEITPTLHSLTPHVISVEFYDDGYCEMLEAVLRHIYGRDAECRYNRWNSSIPEIKGADIVFIGPRCKSPDHYIAEAIRNHRPWIVFTDGGRPSLKKIVADGYHQYFHDGLGNVTGILERMQ